MVIFVRTFCYFLSIHYSYSVLDLGTENVFVVSMKLSVCYESAGPCELNIPVFSEHKLHKPTCNWTRGFAINGRFSSHRQCSKSLPLVENENTCNWSFLLLVTIAWM